MAATQEAMVGSIHFRQAPTAARNTGLTIAFALAALLAILGVSYFAANAGTDYPESVVTTD